MTAANLASRMATPSPAELLDGYSIEMTAKEVERLEEAAPFIPQGTQISVTFLPNEDFAVRRRAAAAVRRLGFVPMPHLSARRLKSEAELEAYLDALAAESEIDRVFVVAGDPPRPEGPYEDALAVIRTGVLGKYGVRHVGISGYPEGHPDISADTLWAALRDKEAVLRDLGHDFSVITQFGFDADPILAWLEEVRAQGVDAPVRIGIAGPTSVKTLLRYAARCGVGASAKVMAKYGVSITRLLSTAGPDPLVRELGEGIDSARHGETLLHLYPFGGLDKAAQWVREFRASA